ncbi:MAG TPA: thermosome subunit beta [Patescibacteria group bacterium]|nr:thermosome subunit beta [Patescibacteria group bacterium]
MAYLTQTQSGQPVLILKEGTSRNRGKEAQKNNIMAAKIIAQVVRSSMGPKGMDKMMVDSMGDVTITNDGATILKEMEVEHPAAKMLVEVSKTQDDEVGDGTTSVVVVAGELLSKAEELLANNLHPTVIVEGYRKAASKALETLERIAIPVKPMDKESFKKIAMTSMASKLVAENCQQLAELSVDAIMHVTQKVGEEYRADLDDIMVEKKTGESVASTRLVKGLVLSKEIAHSEMPKRKEKANIVLLNSAIEIKKTQFDAKINIQDPKQIEAFQREEEGMLRSMVEKISSAGANVVICQKGIDDMAQYFLAKKGILAVKQAKESDMEKLAKATGGKLITTLDNLTRDDLGHAELVEERKIGEDKMTFIEGCKNPHAVAILIRGGTQRILDEAERSIHDALCVVRDVVKEAKIVAGGGAPEEEVARSLRKYAETLPGKEQLAVIGFANAVEIVPITLAENAGLDTIDILSELKVQHEKGKVWAGVNVQSGKVEDMKKLGVLEPLSVKTQMVKSATEAATMILRIDDVIAGVKMKSPPMPPGGPGGMGGMPPQY